MCYKTIKMKKKNKKQKQHLYEIQTRFYEQSGHKAIRDRLKHR